MAKGNEGKKSSGFRGTLGRTFSFRHTNRVKKDDEVQLLPQEGVIEGVDDGIDNDTQNAYEIALRRFFTSQFSAYKHVDISAAILKFYAQEGQLVTGSQEFAEEMVNDQLKVARMAGLLPTKQEQFDTLVESMKLNVVPNLPVNNGAIMASGSEAEQKRVYDRFYMEFDKKGGNFASEWMGGGALKAFKAPSAALKTFVEESIKAVDPILLTMPEKVSKLYDQHAGNIPTAALKEIALERHQNILSYLDSSCGQIWTETYAEKAQALRTTSEVAIENLQPESKGVSSQPVQDGYRPPVPARRKTVAVGQGGLKPGVKPYVVSHNEHSNGVQFSVNPPSVTFVEDEQLIRGAIPKPYVPPRNRSFTNGAVITPIKPVDLQHLGNGFDQEKKKERPVVPVRTTSQKFSYTNGVVPEQKEEKKKEAPVRPYRPTFVEIEDLHTDAKKFTDQVPSRDHSQTVSGIVVNGTNGVNVPKKKTKDDITHVEEVEQQRDRSQTLTNAKKMGFSYV